MYKYYCISCGWNANYESWETRIGRKWVCKTCGISGNCGSLDEPKLLHEDSQGDDESDYEFSRRIFNETDRLS